jgi:2-(1,2-epoxy-1,2-dihydrophenyl)acetyl-CoA isomerase
MSDVSVQLGDDFVGLLEIRRGPENFFDVPLLAALVDGARELAAGGCRAIVLASEGKHFCAGADYAAGDPGEGPELFDLAAQLFEQPLPMVAAVQGAAVGGGLGLALVADFRIAAPEARFAALFARIGIPHGFALTLSLPALVGQQAALDLLYTGRRVPGEEAVRLGLADALVPADQLRAEAHRRAAEIASSAPLAIASIRATMRRPLVAGVRAALAHERAEQQRLKQTDDAREGIAAMAQRRPPMFTAR